MKHYIVYCAGFLLTPSQYEIKDGNINILRSHFIDQIQHLTVFEYEGSFLIRRADMRVAMKTAIPLDLIFTEGQMEYFKLEAFS